MTCERNEQSSILNIYNELINMHGIKPSLNELITENDEYPEMILKFNKWYNRAEEFAWGDSRDQQGFKSIITKFRQTIYPTFKDTIICDNVFIQNLLCRLNIIDYPSKIVNICNTKYNYETEIMNFHISNMNGEYIDSLSININSYSINLYELIFDKIKYRYNLYKLDQLKLLYDNDLIAKGSKLSEIFLFTEL
jgi:hypothetical protein